MEFLQATRHTLRCFVSKLRAWIADLRGKPAVRLLLLLWARLRPFLRSSQRKFCDTSWRTKCADGISFTETIYASRPPPALFRPNSWTPIQRADSPDVMSHSPSVFEGPRAPSPGARTRIGITIRQPTGSMPELRSPPSSHVRQDAFAPFSNRASDTFSSSTHERAFVPLHGHALDTLQTLGHPPSNPASRTESAHGSIRGEDTLHPYLPDLLRPPSARPASSQSMRSVRQSIFTQSEFEQDPRSRTASPIHLHAKPETNDYLRAQRIFTIDTTDVMRYDRPITLKPRVVEPIDPLTLTFSRGDVPSDAIWVAYTHPEGALYFYDTLLKYFTDANLFDPVVCERVEKCRAHIEHAKHLAGAEFPIDAEIVIEIPPPHDEDYAQGYYYCVEPTHRVVFWLNSKPAGPTVGEINLASNYQIMHELESHYWKHWELFPLEREIPERLLQEAIGKLVHAGLDHLTSKTSAAPYNEESCGSLINFLEKTNYVKSIHGYSVVAIARVMADFAHGKYVHFHGLPEARLDRTRARTADGQRPPTMLITLLSPILFFAPDMYFHNIKKIWVDALVHAEAWKKHVTRVQEEWDKYILPATVLLSANFALLAIPSVDQSGPDGPSNTQTVAQIASYLSSATSTAAIIVGMLLDRNYRHALHYDADEAAQHLNKQKHKRYGLEVLAILYSLPFSLLMWGMVTFLAACSALFFQNTSVATRLLAGTFWLLSCTAIMWCVYSTWDGSNPWIHQFHQAWMASDHTVHFSIHDVGSYLFTWKRKGPAEQLAEPHTIVV